MKRVLGRGRNSAVKSRACRSQVKVSGERYSGHASSYRELPKPTVSVHRAHCRFDVMVNKPAKSRLHGSVS